MYGIYDTNDKVILEHGYGSRHGAREKISCYINNHNLFVFGYDILCGTGITGTKKYKLEIQKELISRGIKR